MVMYYDTYEFAMFMHYDVYCLLCVLVSLAGLRLTGTLLFVPQVRDKHGCHPVMSTEGEGTMCTCLVKVGK